MTARLADALPGVWGLTTAVPALAGAAVAAGGDDGRAAGDRVLLDRVRAALSAVWGQDPGALGLARRCPACGSGEHGAPRLTGLPAGRQALISLSGVADDDGAPLRAAAWWTPGPGAGPAGPAPRPWRRGGGPAPAPSVAGLGLDVERADASAFAGSESLGEVGFAADELAWVERHAAAARPAARARLWTRKEALVKAAGTGFRADPAQVPALTPVPGAAVADLAAEVLRAAGLPPAVLGALALRVPSR